MEVHAQTVLAQWSAAFSNPALMWGGLAAVSVPLLIHLLSRFRRRPMGWGAMQFLVEAFRRHHHRLRLEQLLLLLVRCLILVILGLALSGLNVEVGALPTVATLGTGRTVVLVIDDSLSSRIPVAGQTTRFERLKAAAVSLIQSLGSSDRVAVWRAARPVEAVVETPTLDHISVQERVEQMQPRFSRSDLQAALQQLAGVLSQSNHRGQERYLAVLSDLAPDALDPSRRPRPELVTRTTGVVWLVARPMNWSPNVQLMSLKPLRNLLLAEDRVGSTVSVQLSLRRFSDAATPGVTNIELSTLGAEPVVVTRQHEWSRGERVALPQHVTLPIPFGDTSDGEDPSSSWFLPVRARILSSEDDSLEADNEQFIVVELRKRLVVALIDDPSSSLSGRRAPHPRQWLSIAIHPDVGSRDGLSAGPRTNSTSEYGIQSMELPVVSVGGEQLVGADVAMLLRPDLVNHEGWSGLRQFVERGGLLAVFVPPSQAPAAWTGTFLETMGLDWQLGLEPIDEDPPRTLAADVPVPAALDRLAADWRGLLLPVTIARRLDLKIPGQKQDLWLGLSGPQPTPVMASTRRGEGTIVFLAIAIDPAWSNLPTKPLWLPLVHEMIRGVLGRAGEPSRLAKLRVGDEVHLGHRWSSVRKLVQAHAVTPGPTEDVVIDMARSGSGMETKTVVVAPGVYVGQPHKNLKLAINIDPDAGDSRIPEEAVVSDWFNRLGAWHWIEWAAPGAVLARENRLINLTWPLLWLMLAFVLIETCMARWFSHGSRLSS